MNRYTLDESEAKKRMERDRGIPSLGSATVVAPDGDGRMVNLSMSGNLGVVKHWKEDSIHVDQTSPSTFNQLKKDFLRDHFLSVEEESECKGCNAAEDIR